MVFLVVRVRKPAPRASILYSESGADGRIRTGDPLFTKQPLCQLSYVGVRPRLYEGKLAG